MKDFEKTESNKKEDFITWLKFLACLLITNSHCRDIYPLFFLAVGGGHGNAIFFAVSGYCLAHIRSGFRAWYGKRLKRILPVFCIVLFFAVFFMDGMASLRLWGFGGSFLHYVDKYWFIPAILIYYLAYYFLLKPKNPKVVFFALILYIAIYIFLYLFVVDTSVFSLELEGFSPIKVYFYFGVFLLGGLLRLLQAEIRKRLEGKERKCLIGFIGGILLSGIVWCCIYAEMMLLDRAYSLQFLIHLSVFIFILFLFLLCMAYAPKIKIPGNRGGKIVSCLAASTLEIYLVQVTFKTIVVSFDFPLNGLLFFTIAIGGGVLLHRICEPVLRLWK